jgi:Uma2 family endonuclease
MSVMLAPPITQPPTIVYPESNGKPMAETDTHIELTISTRFRLKQRYKDDSQIYVAANLLLYFEEGNPSASVAPDVFVVFGAPNHERRTYRLWEEQPAPAVIFEFTSTSTQREDVRDKRILYEQLGVREHFIFDPMRDYLKPPLKGFRLSGDYYTPLTTEAFDAGEWRLYSEELELELRTDGKQLRLFDPRANSYLRTPQEEAEAREAAEAQARMAEQRAQREAAARRAAEAQAQALVAEVERLKAELARRNP